MATRPTDDQFAFVLTPSEPPPASSQQPISGGASSAGHTGHASPQGGSDGCTVCKHFAAAAPKAVPASTLGSPDIRAAFDAAVGQISITLPEGDVPSIRSAAVVTRSGTQVQHYDVDAAALRSLLLTGRVDWYLPAGAFKPSSVVVTFRLEGEADDAPTHDVTAL